jgi:hypothetical protein
MAGIIHCDPNCEGNIRIIDSFNKSRRSISREGQGRMDSIFHCNSSLSWVSFSIFVFSQYSGAMQS